MPKEVFLSHSSSDRAFITRLAGLLRRHGVPVWFSDTNILGAQQWHDELSWTLSQLQMVGFQNDFHEGCRNLLRIWGIGYPPANH